MATALAQERRRTHALPYRSACGTGRVQQELRHRYLPHATRTEWPLAARTDAATNQHSKLTTKLLDFGCGVRFSQAILNTGLSVRRYVGVDCFAPMIEFLRNAVRDPRFAYFLLDAHHPLYNPEGELLSEATKLPFTEDDFDLICLFSVITHQSPTDSELIFKILRRHIGLNGRLFFTCFLDPNIASFEDRSPERNGGRCFYHPAFLADLVARCGWKVIGTAPSEPPLIGDSFACAPG